MNNLIYPIIAFVAGGAIAIQAGMNSRLGVLLKNSILAATVVYLGSFLFTLVYMILASGYIPDKNSLKSIPFYFWFSGGILSAFAISTMYWLIPRAGVGPMMSYYLVGQLVLSIIASHYGWFNLPLTPATTIKVLGAGMLILGVLMINRG